MFDLSPKAKTLLKKLPKILLFTFIIGIVAWFAAVRPALAYLEKKKFESAYSELQKLSAEIQSKIGPADEVSDDNSCGRAHQKSSLGPLICNVGIRHTYANITPDSATKNMILLSELSNYELRKGNFFGIDSKSSDPKIFELRSNGNTGQIFNQELRKYRDLNCTATYKHEIETNESLFSVYISCGKKALSQHYPLRN